MSPINLTFASRLAATQHDATLKRNEVVSCSRKPERIRYNCLFGLHRIILNLPVLANAVLDCMHLYPLPPPQPWATSRANSLQSNWPTSKNTHTVSNDINISEISSSDSSFQLTRRSSSNGLSNLGVNYTAPWN